MTRPLFLAAMVVCSCGGASCDLPNANDYEEPERNALQLALVLPTEPVPADGATLTRLQVDLHGTLTPSNRRVDFSTTAGTFTSTDKNTAAAVADESGRAVVLLRSPRTVSTALVRAAVGDKSQQRTVDFVRACADTIEVEPSSFAIKADPLQTVNLVATARRRVGQPTPGLNVELRALDGSGNRVGQMGVATLLGESGTATARYSPLDYQGTVRVVAEVCSARGGVVSGTTQIEVIKP